MAAWRKIAALAATMSGLAGAAAADEASVRAALAGHTYASTVGVASYYGPGFHGRPTADGEIFDRFAISAAHKTLPIPSYARVTNLHNGRSVVVRINDRGPYVHGRMLDVSERVARLLAFNGGMEKVRLDYLGMAGPSGADDQRALLTSLRTGADPIAVAKAKPAADEDGVSVAQRSAPALAFADETRRAPAAAALAAAVKPIAAPAPAPEALSLAAKLDASARQIESALESAPKAAVQIAHKAADSAARTLSPYGELVLSPFKPLVEGSASAPARRL